MVKGKGAGRRVKGKGDRVRLVGRGRELRKVDGGKLHVVTIYRIDTVGNEIYVVLKFLE